VPCRLARSIVSLHAGGQVFEEEYLVHFTGFIGKDRRSEFSEENLQISVGCWILRRCRGYRRVFPHGTKLGTNRVVDPS
jgi:hypothetical protein